MANKKTSSLSSKDVSDGVMQIEGLPETEGYQPSKYRETVYDVNGTEGKNVPEPDVYAKRIVHGDSKVRYFIRVDSQGMPINPKDNATNASARRFATLLGSPQTRLVPVSPDTFASYIAFLNSGNMAKYHASCRI